METIALLFNSKGVALGASGSDIFSGPNKSSPSAGLAALSFSAAVSAGGGVTGAGAGRSCFNLPHDECSRQSMASIAVATMRESQILLRVVVSMVGLD